MSVSLGLCSNMEFEHTSKCRLVEAESRCETRLFGRSRHDEATRWCGRRGGRVLRRRRRVLFPEEARQYADVRWREYKTSVVGLCQYIKIVRVSRWSRFKLSSPAVRRRSSLRKSPTSCQFINSIFTRAAASDATRTSTQLSLMPTNNSVSLPPRLFT